VQNYSILLIKYAASGDISLRGLHSSIIIKSRYSSVLFCDRLS